MTKSSKIKVVIKHHERSDTWLEFTDPVHIYKTFNIKDIVPILNELETKVFQENLYAVGFISYEASPAFDAALLVKPDNKDFPLLWFGLFKKPTLLKGLPPYVVDKTYTIDKMITNETFESYQQNIQTIKREIAAGATYQVNHTYQLAGKFSGDPFQFFCDIARNQEAAYSAYFSLGRYHICSASPELFFIKNKKELLCKPMKGTVQRGSTNQQDLLEKEWLYTSEKNRAENLMIVDMIRNDMGKIADTGSVTVPSLFTCEKYPTLWQMTSTVRCTTNAPVSSVFKALFPCASITGAPKVSTMDIISKHEKQGRGLYTGCIGYISPKGNAVFSVAIRTPIVDTLKNKVTYGVGGGIVWQSNVHDEYHETRLKADFLAADIPDFKLLETIGWNTNRGFYLLQKHLKRLTDSSQYFDYVIDIKRVKEQLLQRAARLKNNNYKIRLLVDKKGQVKIESYILENPDKNAIHELVLAKHPIQSSTCFLYHKTTNRKIYEQAKTALGTHKDVLLYNEKGEITETCIANIVIKYNNVYITPPVFCGLLAGTYRNYLLSKKAIKEKVITLEMIKNADELYCINSVRKKFKAIIVAD